MRMLHRIAGLAAAALVAAACTGSEASPSPAATPTPSPTQPAADVDFTVQVLPAEDPVEARPAIPGQKVIFLVVVTSPGSDEPVNISATVAGAKVFKIEPAELKPGVVGEVWVVPDAATEETAISTDITAARGAATHTERRTTKVMPFENGRAEEVQPYFAMWVDWLAANHPEFGITRSTEWDSSFTLALLIVSHYAFFSDAWEMKISWHVMIAPDDFTEVYLRHRGTDSAWTHAFRMDSFSGRTAVYEVTPDDFRG
jgi:hypothetical protein